MSGIPVIRVKVHVEAVDVDGAGVLAVTVGGPMLWLVVDHDDWGPVLRWPADQRDKVEVHHGQSPAAWPSEERERTEVLESQR